jgi:hypothetical protein
MIPPIGHQGKPLETGEHDGKTKAVDIKLA